MKDKIKKITAWTMLLALSLTTPVSSVSATELEKDVLAYSADYIPVIRDSQPTVVSLSAEKGITNKTLPITLSLRDSDVQQVLRMFADKAGLNIIFKGDFKSKITMDLVNIPLNSAFDMVLTTSDLTYAIQDNTLIIMKAGDDSSISKQNLTVIPVKYLDAAAAANFLNKNIYGMKRPGLSGTEIATVNPLTNEILIFGSDNDVAIARKVLTQFDKKPSVTTFKVNHTTPAQMAGLVCNMLLPGIGIGEGDTDEDDDDSDDDKITLGSGTVACSTKDSKAGGGSSGGSGGALASLDLIGLSVAFQTQRGTVSVIGGSPEQIEMIREFIDENDKRQPQAYLEFSIIELSEDGSRAFNSTWSFQSKHFTFNYDGNGTSSFSPITIFGDKQTYTTGNSTLLYTLNLLLKNEKGRVLSNPRILVTNGQESTIDMTSDYIKTVTSQIVQGTTSMTPTTQRTYDIGDDEGIKIEVTPFISPDGYVYLNLTPDYTSIKSQQVDKNPTTNENDVQVTLLSRRNLELKNVRIKDGDTLILGGMMIETEKKNVNKIPFLGDIPGAGALFRSSNVMKSKSELVILVTPKIIDDTDTSATNNAL